jgi:hypothetical protein
MKRGTVNNGLGVIEELGIVGRRGIGIHKDQWDAETTILIDDLYPEPRPVVPVVVIDIPIHSIIHDASTGKKPDDREAEEGAYYQSLPCHYSLLPKKQIHRPAPTDMRARTAKMPKDVGVLATRFFQRIGQHSQAFRVEFAGRQGTFLVGDLGEVGHCRRHPVGFTGSTGKWGG